MAEKQPQSRGRNVVSKPLHGKTKSGTSTKPLERTQSASSMTNKPITETPTQEESEFKVTKLSSTTVKLSSTSWTPPAPPPKVPPRPPQLPETLQVAAQVYPWTYMTSTLDACFKSAEIAATTDLETRTKELKDEESDISEQRERLEAQRAIEFYDELGSDLFATEAPAIIQQFHSHGDSCTKIETEALKLAARGTPGLDDEEPLKPYNKMLDALDELQNEATKLEDLITKLTERALATPDKGSDTEVSSDESNTEPTARQQIVSVFSACLPVLKARVANLLMAQELVDSALENVSLTLRMESLGIAD